MIAGDRVIVIGMFGKPFQTGTIVDTSTDGVAYQVKFDRPLAGDTIKSWWVERSEVVLKSEFTASFSSPQEGGGADTPHSA